MNYRTHIQVRNIHKKFGKFTALGDINLEFSPGKLVALLGPSGSGKTTLLRIIAGLESPDAGSIFFGDDDVTDTNPKNRQVGFVFQHYALFRHMNVVDNVSFGLTVRKKSLRPPKQEIRRRALRLLELVQLTGLENRFPSQLSGGQRQRVALARALAVEPRVLLLDEPFGALDAKVRKELRRWLRVFHEEMGVTTVFVTHDQEEALEIADEVVVMDHGCVEQVGTPQDVYDRPASAFVYEFLGNVNAVRAEVRPEGARIGQINLPRPTEPAVSGSAVAYIRPHDVDVDRHQNGTPSLEVIVKYIHAAGPVTRIQFERPETGESIEAEVPRLRGEELCLVVGDTAFLKFRGAQIYSKPRDDNAKNT